MWGTHCDVCHGNPLCSKDIRYLQRHENSISDFPVCWKGTQVCVYLTNSYMVGISSSSANPSPTYTNRREHDGVADSPSLQSSCCSRQEALFAGSEEVLIE